MGKIQQMGLYLYTDVFPYPVVDYIRRSPLQRILLEIRKKTYRKMVFSNIDWPNTKAFSWEPCGFGNIQINTEGVFKHGTVKENSSEYDQLRNMIIEKLQQLKNPHNGEAVIEKVVKREDLYHGNYTHLAPDLIVIPSDYAYAVSDFGGAERQIVFSDLDENNPIQLGRTITGCHHPLGIFISYGNKIKKNCEIHKAKIEDIAPTLLHLMKCPIDEDMDGKVLEEIFV